MTASLGSRLLVFAPPPFIDLSRSSEGVPGERGGPLAPLLDRLDWWLHDPQWSADAFIEVAAVERIGDEARELVDDPTPTVFLHGDMIPGNLLLRHGRLHALIDWSEGSYGDPVAPLELLRALVELELGVVALR